MRKFYFLLLQIFIGFSLFSQTTVSWNFGTGTSSPNPFPSSGIPVPNITISEVTQGNNNGTTPLLTTTSASSSYTGASGSYNAGAAARIGVLNTGISGSAYFEFTITPLAGTNATITSINFGTRSTGSGPTAYSIRTSLNNYTSDVASGAIVTTNTPWAFKTNAVSISTVSSNPITIRIYGHSGAGSPAAGTANWRIDDLAITLPSTSSGSLVAINSSVNTAEAGTNGSFTFTFNPGTSIDPTSINYAFSGSASFGTDYSVSFSTGTSNSITASGMLSVPAGTSAVTVTVTPTEDAIVEPTETIVLTLNNPTNGYTTSSTPTTINLEDNDVAPPTSITLTSVYTQDFNTLANTGTSTSLPTGWLFLETGSSANNLYTANTGSSNSGDTYSFGANGSNERALGSQQSGATIPTIGAYFTNNTGKTITTLQVSYTGEQWRLGARDREDRLDFQYSTDATNLGIGTWIDINELDFISPDTTIGGGARDGNAMAYQKVIMYKIVGLSIPEGATFYIRWNSFDAAGADDGLAIDNFSIEANPLDLAAPKVNSLTPINGATDIAMTTTATIAFDEAIQKGIGNIYLRSMADGSIIKTINITDASVTVSGQNLSINLSNLVANTGYYITIESGAVEDVAGNDFTGFTTNNTWAFTTGSLLFNANLNACASVLPNGFTQFSQVGTAVWACTPFGRDPNAPTGTNAFPNGVQINGYANNINSNNTDWLISPSFDLTNTSFPLLSFWSRTAFNGAPLELKVSTNYTGGDPSTATWVDVNGKFPAQTSNIWTLSENINLSAFKQANVHFAFVYSSSTEDGARWTLDDIKLVNSSTPPPPSLSVGTSDIQFAFVASGASAIKTFELTANDIKEAFTITATGAFQLSKDGSTFASSISYSVEEANNVTKTVQVRFTPTENRKNYTGEIAIAFNTTMRTITLKGTSIDPTTTLEVVNWNIEWFGSTEQDPKNDVLQEQNVKTIMQNIKADVFALSEVVNEDRLKSVVSQMPGYAYVISNFSSHTNTARNPESALASAQKLAFVYKTDVISNVRTQALLSKGINTIEDLNSAPYEDWSSGRYPYMMTADVTLNCVTKQVRFVLVHAKANTSPTTGSYNRRKEGADSLYKLLNETYADQNIVILGDFNDDLDQSITDGFTTSSWNQFVIDKVNYSALTLPLSEAGKKSTLSYNDVIDHVVVSNEMNAYYMPGTASILADVTSLVTNYKNTTSDHLPVFTRYIFENPTPPSVISCPVVTPTCATSLGTYTIPAFKATVSCGIPTYSFEISGATNRIGTGTNASGEFNIGTSIITWTVKDSIGQINTCQTTIVINDTPRLSIPDVSVLPSGVIPNTVYIGYAPAATITLQASANNGTAPYTYTWSTGAASASVQVSPTTPTVYTVTATDINGCQTIAQKSIIVRDVRGGKNMDKVMICHKPGKQINALAVDAVNVANHLSHGDDLGNCAGTTTRIATETTEENPIILMAVPNPSSNYYTITIEANGTEKVSLRIMDASGKVVEKMENIGNSRTIQLGSQYKPGIYILEIIQGKNRQHVRLAKLKN